MSEPVAIDLVGAADRCGPDCPAFLERWQGWWAVQRTRPAALLDVGGSQRDYHERIGPKGRNMARKATRLYAYQEFRRDSHLDEMYIVNTSKPVRSGGPMRGHYLDQPQPTCVVSVTCARHCSTWQGGFDADHRLVAYCNLVVLNELAVVNTILGHADCPAAVNGLVDHMVAVCRERGVRFIHYLSIESSPDGLARFKSSVGFRSRVVA